MTLHNYMANVSLFTMLTINCFQIFVYQFVRFTYFLYFKSKKELNYNRFIDLNMLRAARLVNSDQQIYGISFFPLDLELNYAVPLVPVRLYNLCLLNHMNIKKTLFNIESC